MLGRGWKPVAVLGALLAVVSSGCKKDETLEFFTKNRLAYDNAVTMLRKQGGENGWRELPFEFRGLSKSNSVLVMGEPGSRMYLFDFEEGSDWVRYVGYTEQVRRDLGKAFDGPSDAWWTEKFLDDHWQISGAMP